MPNGNKSKYEIAARLAVTRAANKGKGAAEALSKVGRAASTAFGYGASAAKAAAVHGGKAGFRFARYKIEATGKPIPKLYQAAQAACKGHVKEFGARAAALTSQCIEGYLAEYVAPVQALANVEKYFPTKSLAAKANIFQKHDEWKKFKKSPQYAAMKTMNKIVENPRFDPKKPESAKNPKFVFADDVAFSFLGDPGNIAYVDALITSLKDVRLRKLRELKTLVDTDPRVGMKPIRVQLELRDMYRKLEKNQKSTVADVRMGIAKVESVLRSTPNVMLGSNYAQRRAKQAKNNLMSLIRFQRTGASNSPSPYASPMNSPSPYASPMNSPRGNVPMYDATPFPNNKVNTGPSRRGRSRGRSRARRKKSVEPKKTR